MDIGALTLLEMIILAVVTIGVVLGAVLIVLKYRRERKEGEKRHAAVMERLRAGEDGMPPSPNIVENSNQNAGHGKMSETVEKTSDFQV